MHEKTLATRRAFDGRLLKVDVLDVELESGVKSVREIIRHPGATVVLARLPDGRFIFVRQFRKPLEREMLEVVAGTLDPGESPEQCAARELEEETGYRPAELVKLGVIVPAPGYTDEKLHCYYAPVKPERGEAVGDHDEAIEQVYLTEREIGELMASGGIEDAKTIAAWHLYLVKVRSIA